MMSKKLKLAVLCGGQSAEHEVSIVSAKNIVKALDKRKYHISIVYITKEGHWFLIDRFQTFLATEKLHSLIDSLHCRPIEIVLGNHKHWLRPHGNGTKMLASDVVFPVLHGSHGEDGTLQGLLKLVGIPFVGAGVLSSALCMDKVLTKRLLQAQSIPTPNWMVWQASDKPFSFVRVRRQLGLPFFVKPANGGSSVGISKVNNTKEYAKAIELARQYDDKIIIEECIKGREIECAVLGNENPQASALGEIIPLGEFYTYQAKYIEPDEAILKVPAALTRTLARKIQQLAVQAFQALECRGMARVDFLVRDKAIYVNELNTIPGFTSLSMYPLLWIESGVSYSALLDKLIALSFVSER